MVPGAEFIEKEISELFGVEFVGQRARANLVLPDDWPTGKRPLRKPLVGDVIPQARASVENLLSGGTSIRVGPSSAVKREKAGLPKVPPLVSAKEDQMQEVQGLAGADRVREAGRFRSENGQTAVQVGAVSTR